jgi:hypothetical protein
MKELHRLKKGRDVLIVLKEHGVLSCRTLKLLTPGIRYDRNRRKILEMLLKKRLIVKRIQRFEPGKSYMNFYQLNQQPEIREVLSQYLNCTSDDLRQLQWRFLTPILEQLSIEAAYWMRQRFPTAIIIHDYNFTITTETKKVLPNYANEKELIPDLLILAPEFTHGRTLNLAIETSKHDDRKIKLDQKLEYYLTQTNIDAVMFVGTLGRAEEQIMNFYSNIKLQKILNSRAQNDFFFVVHTNVKNFAKGLELLVDQKGQKQNFESWLAKIKQSFAQHQQSINSGQVCTTSVL